MHITPDEVVLWEHGFIKINATLATTWAMMLVLVLGAWLITRRLSAGMHISRWQNVLEIIVLGIRDQIREVGLQEAGKYVPFIGTMFLFIATANLCAILPNCEPPTGSLSTTAALAICVFLAVPIFGIRKNGVIGYVKSYFVPTPIMAPFHLISEVSRTIALSVRLFGNMMSGSLILLILLSITPFLFPIVMSLLGLLTGMVQAYIFSILSTVFIAAAVNAHQD